jgi:hypothetical protein
MPVKSERFPCGCSLEWDGKKATVNICEWHQNETRKLKVKLTDAIDRNQDKAL